MSPAHEFHYRMPSQVHGYRPGSHHGSSIGGGQAFATHARLFDHPDPRRLDLRASLRHPGREWLVRLHRQRSAVTLHALVDVSASMTFGSPRTKLDIAGDFVDALGRSAFRVGDPVGLLAFDTALRDELTMPARRHRGAGAAMRALLHEGRRLAAPRGGSGAAGLRRAAERLGGREGIVFVVSDFHWPLDTLRGTFELMAPALVVPLVVWDPVELEAPSRNALMMVRDAESHERRALWMRPALRMQWRDAVRHRRAQIDGLCRAHGVRPLYLSGTFDPETVSRYFLEMAG